ncbi:DUF4224 domain-containing protein [Burkholderia multivorans]|nr:DUF4224 domain-containing protein [Burkholderia multivorans]MBU9308325.1 DUF4224 domain-containing protein [Burkholderia multivorans]
MEVLQRILEISWREWTVSDTFLSSDEVAELSGIKTGRNGKTREQLQIAWLRSAGVPFWTNARGRPIVARSAIDGSKHVEEKARKKSVPQALLAG